MPLGSFRLNSISMGSSVVPESYFILYSTDYSQQWNLNVDNNKNMILDNMYADCKFLKIAETGTITWQKQLSITNGNYTGGSWRTAVLDSSGNVIWCMYNGGTGTNWFVGSINGSSGAANWSSNRNGMTYNYMHQPLIDSSGNIWIPYSGESQGKLTLGKFNSSGSFQSDYALSLYGTYWQIRSSAIDSSNNKYVFACSGSSQFDTTLFKWDSSGTYQWSYEVSQSPASGALTMKCDSSGNVILHRNKYINKIDTDGSVVWSKQLSITPTSVSAGNTLDVDSAGNIYFAFEYNNKNQIIKLNSSGSIVWHRSFNTNSSVSREGPKLIVKGDNFYLYGTGNVASGTDGTYIMKAPTDGTLTGTYSSMVYQSETSISVSDATCNMYTRSPTAGSGGSTSGSLGTTLTTISLSNLSKTSL
jgi:hypothetical protein